MKKEKKKQQKTPNQKTNAVIKYTSQDQNWIF